MTGVDEAIARGLADPNRLGCTGKSYGGYMTCWIVGHTDRFKAGVAEASATNMVNSYGTGDIPGWEEDALGGPPYARLAVYQRCSPMTYAHLCKTPTLLIVGEHDWRCPPDQTEQFYGVLKSTGCTTEMLRFPESSHGGTTSGSLDVRRAQNEALLEWMDRFVGR
jgi:dipeptidyl aminopeptidase/acylaminoacyl peptidase